MKTKNEIIRMFIASYETNGLEECKKICLEKSVEENKIALGLKYLRGFNCKKDFQKSYQYFFDSLLSDKHSKEEMSYVYLMIAQFFRNGLYVRKDFHKAINYYEKSSDIGNTIALFQLAFIYHMGEGGIEKNFEKAIKYYEIASKYGNKDAYFNMGIIFEDGGYNIEKDINKAILYYEKGAEEGSVDCMLNLAMLYFHTEEKIENKNEKLIYYFEKAAEKNNIKALINLAIIYQDGEKGIEKNIKKSIFYYQRLVELKDPYSCRCLGNFYKQGNQLFQKNIEKSLFYYEKAVEYGDLNSLTILGNIYYTGDGVAKDFEKSAFYFFQKFKKNKSSNALKKLFDYCLINWKPEYHQFWNCSINLNLNEKILFLLLISKNRKESSLQNVDCIMVKGITMNIIKFLCHFCEKKKKVVKISINKSKK